MTTPDADDILEAMATNATNPKKVKVGNQEVESQDIDQQMKAADRLKANQALAAGRTGVYVRKIRPNYE